MLGDALNPGFHPKIRLLQLNWCIILGIQKQQRAHCCVSVRFKEAKARHYLAFMDYFPFFSQQKMCCNWNLKS